MCHFQSDQPCPRFEAGCGNTHHLPQTHWEHCSYLLRFLHCFWHIGCAGSLHSLLQVHTDLSSLFLKSQFDISCKIGRDPMEFNVHTVWINLLCCLFVFINSLTDPETFQLKFLVRLSNCFSDCGFRGNCKCFEYITDYKIFCLLSAYELK